MQSNPILGLDSLKVHNDENLGNVIKRSPNYVDIITDVS